MSSLKDVVALIEKLQAKRIELREHNHRQPDWDGSSYAYEETTDYKKWLSEKKDLEREIRSLERIQI